MKSSEYIQVLDFIFVPSISFNGIVIDLEFLKGNKSENCLRDMT